ncbi:hypothetical protein GCM10028818_40830 [Spirosoma horti]
MENTALLQSGLILATIALYAVCLTTHNTSKALMGSLYALTLSTFVSFVCLRWIPALFYDVLAFTFLMLTVSAGLGAYNNFWQPETNRAKVGAKVAYSVAAFLLLAIILWSFDNYRSQRTEKVLNNVATKVDTIAAGQKQNRVKISKIETKLDTLAKSDTMLAKTVEATKSELWDKTDQSANEIKDGLSTLSLQQHRMNTDRQKQKPK